MTDKTILLRQIHATHIHNDRIASVAFRPSRSDNAQLSTYHGDMISPEDSYIHYTDKQRLDSEGVAGVSVSECKGINLGVIHDGFDFPEHVSIDFSVCKSKGSLKGKSKILSNAANERDWIFVPEKEA